MVNLSVEYLGLKLKNPIIVSSSGLTSNIKSIKNLEAMGASAIVLKSIFEEQIDGEIVNMSATNTEPEAYDYISTYLKDNNIATYAKLISDAKQECSIPIIASINCYRDGDWVNLAKRFEDAGADALELNIFYMPNSKEEESSKIEDVYLSIASSIVEAINIPVSVKMANHFTNPISIVNKLYYRGVKGVVLFNRLYEPDIDIENFKYKSAPIFSSPIEMKTILRWVALCSSNVGEIDYSASTGIHSKEDVIKMLLAGANTVQLCSVIYNKGGEVIESILTGLVDWLNDKCIEDVNMIIGRMNASNDIGNVIYERSQFMKYFQNYK